MHWPNGVPKVIADLIREMREKAEAFTAAAEFATAMLLIERVEGVGGKLQMVTLEFDIDEDETDDEVEPWQS